MGEKTLPTSKGDRGAPGARYIQKKQDAPWTTGGLDSILSERSVLPFVGIDAQQGALNRSQLAHLLRRIGFAATKTEIEQAYVSGVSATTLVNSLLDGAENAPHPTAPAWKNTYGGAGELKDMRIREYRFDWLREMVNGNGVREKLALFWHTHFTTEFRVYGQPAYTYRYLKLIREQCLGNYKDFVRLIGLTPAMVRYLDSNLNTATNPNENYARELCELFTMGRLNQSGQENYTEQDVIEIARALTGYQVNFDTIETVFDDFLFDSGQKTFFGRTGNFGYDDVVDIIFEERERETALRICDKIYRYYLYEVPNSSVVSAMADLLIAGNFEIRPVLAQLLTSRHFFQEKAWGGRIKNPIEFLVGMLREADFSIVDDGLEGTYKRVYEGARDLTMDLFNPPDVSGWPGDRAWLSTSLLTKRWEIATYLLSGPFYQELPDQNLVPWAKQVSPDHSSAELTVAAANEFLFPRAVDVETEDSLLAAFKLSIPDEEFDGGYWTLNRSEAPEQMRSYSLAAYILPEYQLT